MSRHLLLRSLDSNHPVENGSDYFAVFFQTTYGWADNSGQYPTTAGHGAMDRRFLYTICTPTECFERNWAHLRYRPFNDFTYKRALKGKLER